MSDESVTALSQLQIRLQQEVKSIAETLGAHVVTSFVYDDLTAQFHLPAGHNLLDPATFEDPRLVPRTGRVAGKIARDREPIIASNVKGHINMDGPFARRERILSAAGYPLEYDGRCVGVLFISYREPHVFAARPNEAVEAEARRLGDIVGTAMPWEELRRTPEPRWRGDNPTFRATLELVCDYLKPAVAIWQLQPDGVNLSLVAGSGLSRRYLDEARASIGDNGWLSSIVQKNDTSPFVLNNLQDEDRFRFKKAAHAAGWCAALGFPVRSQGQVRGVIEGLFFEPVIHSSDRDVLRRLAELAGVIMDNAERDREAQIQEKVLQGLRQALDLEQALQVIVEGAIELTGAERGCIYKFDENETPTVLCGHPSDISVPNSCELHATTLKTDQPPDEAAGGCKRQIEVQIRANEAWIGTLYVRSRLPWRWTRHHERLLTTLANQASLALRPPLLLDAAKAIERASTQLFDQERVFGEVLDKVRSLASTWSGENPAKSLDFAALQITNQEERVIAAVDGFGRAREWVGRAKHYLEPIKNLRDIQPDLALASPPRVEIISGNDPRFDKWIFETYQHHKFIRAFVPLVLIRTSEGKVLQHDEIDECTRSWCEGIWDKTGQADGIRQYVRLTLPRTRSRASELTWETIGTIEAGYEDGDVHTITREQAVELVRLAAHCAVDIYPTLLEHLFQTVVDQAVRIVGAKYAILHFGQVQASPGSDNVGYVYEVFSGQFAKNLLRHHPPRVDGLGQKAILSGQAMFVPDPSQGHGDQELRATNPGLYNEGVRSMAAIPLLVGNDSKLGRGFSWTGTTELRQGVLYVGFGELPTVRDSRVHYFTPSEIGWLGLFAKSAAEAIRHATAYTRMREQARLLSNLHSVAGSLVGNLYPEPPQRRTRSESPPFPDEERANNGGLLHHIAGSVLNILGADVVTIYEYLESKRIFLTPPDRAGRLCDERKMSTEIGENDSPMLLVNHGCSIYSRDSATHPVLTPANRRRPPDKGQSFVEREGITSSAGILLEAGGKLDQREHKEIVGVMFINFRRCNEFSTEQRRLIETLASTAAAAIKNRRLLEAFLTTDRKLLQALSSDDVFDHITDNARVLTRADVGEIWLVNPVYGGLESRALSYPGKGSALPPLSDSLRWSFAQRVMSTKDAVLLHSVQNDNELAAIGRADEGSAFGLPLRDEEDAVLGVLAVFDSHPGTFHSRNRTLLEALTVPVVLALQNGEHRKRLRAGGDVATLGWVSSKLLHRFSGHVGLFRKWAGELELALRDVLAVAEPAVLESIVDDGMATSRQIKLLAEEIQESTDSLSKWERERTSEPKMQKAVDIVPIIQRAWDSVQAGDGRPHKIRIDGHFTEPQLHVRGEDNLFLEIFRNLFRNALDAMPEEGTLTVNGMTAERVGKPWVVITLSNPGQRIPKGVLDSFRLGLPVASEKGLGLSLYLSRTYVEHLGGHFDIQNGSDEQTVVTIVLRTQAGSIAP